MVLEKNIKILFYVCSWTNLLCCLYFRLCLDEVYSRKSETQEFWEELPQSLCHWLQEKHKIEELCKPYDDDSDSDNSDQGNEPGVACSIS